MNKVKIEKNNKVLADYFAKNKNVTRVRALDMMDEFVKAGIFKSDSERAGLPIRSLLRELDRNNLLDLIPYIVVERKEKNRNWYFEPIE